MEGTNKVVSQIIGEYLTQISKIEGITPTFLENLSKILRDERKVTAQRLEELMYSEESI